MREEILKTLSEMTEEELFSPDESTSRAMYSKSGRFIIERRTISNISVGESTAPVCMRSHPRFRPFPEHTHDYIEIMYVFSGTITHRIGGQSVTVSKGDMIALGKGAVHSIAPSSISDIGINLIISPDLFEIILNGIRRDSTIDPRSLEVLISSSDKGAFCVFGTSEHPQISNLMESMIYSAVCKNDVNSFVFEQSVKLLLCYLCSISHQSEHFSFEDRHSDLTKKRIIEYVRSSYSSATLTEAADMLGLSAPYLSRLIRKEFGVSFKDLIMRERFSVAADLLSTTSIPIGDVILQVGYENSSYFHREFKKRFGITPKEYRRENRGGATQQVLN